MIYAFTHYYASAAGAATKTVVCEKCGETFHYTLVRTGRGEGQSPYFLDNEGARGRADAEAAASLRARLDAGVEPVPCPNCRWYQAHMVKEMRRRRLRWMFILGTAASAILMLLIWIVILFGSKAFEQPVSEAAKTTAWQLGAGLALALSGIGLRWRLVRRFDPNASWSWPEGTRTSAAPMDTAPMERAPIEYASPQTTSPITPAPRARAPAIVLGIGFVALAAGAAGTFAEVVPLAVLGLLVGFPSMFFGLKLLRSAGY